MLCMVLAVIDDLMLRSRVSTAGAAGRADVRFVSGTQEAFLRAADVPSLIILDLNARRTNALELIGLLKADAAAAQIRIVGFVSHVDTETIAAARRAGIDVVLARGAFMDQLPDILAGSLPPAL